MKWQELPQSGQVPGPRSSHALAAVGNKLYLFGGELQPRVPLPANLYCYDLTSSSNSSDSSSSSSSGSWNIEETSGCCPGPRVAATMAAIDSKLYLYGGRTGVDMGEGAKSDLCVFDTDSKEWAPVEIAAGTPQPPPRSYHSMAAVPSQQKLYVFGGCGSSGRLADLWCFTASSSSSGSWQQCASSDSIPARGGSVLIAAKDGSKVYLLGGFNPSVPTGAELQDCHVYDTATDTWACPTCCNSSTPATAADGAEPAAAAAAGEDSSSSSSSLAMMLGRSVFGAVLHSGGHSRAPSGASGCGKGCEHAEHVVTFGGEVAPSDKGHAGAGNFTDVLHCLAPHSSNGSNGGCGSSGGCGGSNGSSSGWHSLSVCGTGPGPRGWFASTSTADGGMVVHGGLGADNERRGDLFMLCMHE